MYFSPLRKTIALSLAIHAGLFFSLLLIPKSENQDKQTITIDLLPKKEIGNSELKKALQALEKKMKLVEQTQLNSDLDENAKYLSSHNQKVIKETVAKNHGLFNNSIASVAGQKNDNQKKGKAEISNSHEPIDIFGYKKTSERFKNLDLGNGSSGSGGTLAQSLEGLKGVDPGLQTLLSTREFVFFSYYNRIRNQLSQHWEPLIKDKFLQLYRQGREPASAQDRITKVVITLDAEGILKKVQVINESGIRDLDEAAVEAFRAAAPFPNPPKGIIDENGTIQINWDFIIEA